MKAKRTTKRDAKKFVRVNHSCGHDEYHPWPQEGYAKNESELYAEGVASRPCTDCATRTVKQFKISEESSRSLRILALQRGKLVPELCREIVEEYVTRQHRPKGRGKA